MAGPKFQPGDVVSIDGVRARIERAIPTPRYPRGIEWIYEIDPLDLGPFPLGRAAFVSQDGPWKIVLGWYQDQ